jgi:zinc protease
MKKAACILVLITAIFFHISKAQSPSKIATLIEKVNKEEGKLSIPYEKYKLDNGLTLIIQEDHSDPMVHVEVFYHVGSTRDEAGRSGFAHFYEHMMFEGSDHLASGELHQIVGAAGGTDNGNTTVDRTVYFETVPSNYLETALWMEADRMGFFLDKITAQKFENQRETVKNERGQNYDNKPYGLVQEKINAALYPIDNPYSTPTIGYVTDLNKADINELKRFFLRWYGPNNATLVVAGDVDSKEVVKMTEKYFGSIDSGPAIPKLRLPSVILDDDRYISYEDNIRNPLLEIVYPTIPTHDKDEAPLDILADIIGGDGFSLLYKKFVGVENSRASFINVTHPCFEAAGRFEISLTLMPDEDLSEAEKDVRKVLDDFETRGVRDDDLIKFKADYMNKFFNRISTISGKAEQLGNYEWRYGNPGLFQSEYDRYMNVTKEDVMAAYQKYIKNQHAIILSVYPKGKSKIVAKKDNFILPQRTEHSAEELEYKNLVYKKSKDNFDRFKKPLPGPDPIVKAPELWQQTFENGLRLMGIHYDEQPRVTIQMSIDAGHTTEEKDNSGIGTFVSKMFNESTEFHSGYFYTTELKKMGSEIYMESRMDDLLVTIISRKENLDRTLQFLNEKLFHLKFSDIDFDWERNKLLDRISLQSKSAPLIADKLFKNVLYGNNSVFGTPVIGTTETMKDISLRDVKKYFKANFVPSNCKLVVVGDIQMDDLLPKLYFLKNWLPQEYKKEIKREIPIISKTRLYFVNKENSVQSEIRIGTSALPFDPLGEQYKCTIMNGALGEGFACRINTNLREEKGYSYGAHSYFYGTKYEGQFIAKSSVKLAQTDSAVFELMEEIKLYADKGVTEKELEQTKKSFTLNEALRYESPEQKANFLWRLMYYNLDKDYMSMQHKLLNTINKAEIDQLAKKYLTYNNMIILVVSDKSVLPKLQKLGYEIVEINIDGKIVN